MAASSSYKQTARNQRTLYDESNFNFGMNYTNDPLMDGSLKVAVNYDYVNRGASMRPRGGYAQIADIDLGVTAEDFRIHHIDSAFIEDVDNSDAHLRKYTLVGERSANGILVSGSRIVIENELNNTFNIATLSTLGVTTGEIVMRSNANWTELHGMTMHDPISTGIYAVVDNVPYVLYLVSGVYHLGKLLMSFTGGVYTFKLEEAVPDEISPLEAVNYGYNLLDDDPYNFTNESNPTGALILQGILPYDKITNELKFNGNVGETIKFNLIYSYPTSHVGTKTYAVRWEYKKLTDDATIETIQSQDVSPVYAPGDTISVEFPAPYKQFTVIAKVFAVGDLVNPLRAIQLASYNLSSDTNSGSTANITPINYDLQTATNMATWGTQLVLWGVKNAATTLFMSEHNNPMYFPFPNNAEVFDEPIVRVIPYLGDLMVFTTSKLIRLKYDYINFVMTREVIQERLYLSINDTNTIALVSNMIYFKSGNYYYMIVPKSQSTIVGALQLAPISTPIALMLDTFEASMREIISTMYEIDVILGGSSADFLMELQSYSSYLDGDEVKNVFKFKVYLTDQEASARYIDVSLNYDTLLRNWKMSCVETNFRPMYPYRKLVTDNTVYANVYSVNDVCDLQLLRQNDLYPVDTFDLDDAVERKFYAHQFLDTGYREHSSNAKKRFRELQFKINNLAKVDLSFYSAFYVDNIERRGIYKYDLQHITDPLNPNYGLIYVERSLTNEQLVPGITALGVWTLGITRFPDISVVKVRMHVSGKGYAGRLQLLSKNEVPYELLNTLWVFRLMNAR